MPLNIIEKFMRWLTPYKYENQLPEKKAENKKIKKAKDELTAKEHVEKGMLGISLRNMVMPVTKDEAKQRLKTCSYDSGFFIHTETHHQLLARFESDSAFRYQHRSDAQRKKLVPLIYPLSKVSYDRTHLIPIGFHGSESDDRLLIGWNSNLNRGEMNEWEKNVKRYNKKNDILWFIDIQKNVNGTVSWQSTVWNNKGKEVFNGSWLDTDKFMWKT